MNTATDLIARDHTDLGVAFTEFERTHHRTSALDLCELVERHRAMEDAVLHPVVAAVDPEAEERCRAEHEAHHGLLVRIRETSSRRELRDLVAELAIAIREHAAHEEGAVLPAMEDALGVARMNALGMDLLTWQHDVARQERETEDQLDELLELTREELYERAQEVDLDGRSTMKKAELAEALAER